MMMVESSGLDTDENILEIGPGYGTLTSVLLDALEGKGRLIAVEKDPEARAELASRLGDHPKLDIVAADVQQFSLPEDFAPFRIIANIPYYITTPLLKQFLLEASELPKSITLLVQKEYAEKACQEAPKSSSLGIMLQCFGTPAYVATVPKELFSPPPKVDSAILHLDITKQAPDKKFLSFVQQGFAQPRKKLAKTLRRLGKEPGAHADKRPEQLSLEDWQALYQQK